MAYKRVMYFIDGENIVIRYQEMKKDGYIPKDEVIHESNVFVWHPNMIEGRYRDIIRVIYYTSATGDDTHIFSLRQKIQNLPYLFFRDTRTHDRGRVHPKVFKKSRQEEKAKGVDINITIDALSYTFNNSVDIIQLVTGDGDYLPLIKEIMRMGKQVTLAALSKGLNPNLPLAADSFLSLDDILFKQKQEEETGKP